MSTDGVEKNKIIFIIEFTTKSHSSLKVLLIEEMFAIKKPMVKCTGSSNLVILQLSNTEDSAVLIKLSISHFWRE